jgi:hypothetical protein
MDEMTYTGNIGFEEMVRFYQVASSTQFKNIKIIINKGNWLSFNKLIYQLLVTKLESKI